MWQNEMSEMLRFMVWDIDSNNQIYSDNDIQRILVIAAQLIVNKLDFSQDFSPDINSIEISPDPCASATRDDNFINLVTMKAACMIERALAVKNAGNAFSIRDIGGISVDLKEAHKARLALLEKGGWCPEFEKEISDYQMGSRVVGAAILSPFRTMANYSRVAYLG